VGAVNDSDAGDGVMRFKPDQKQRRGHCG